MGGSRLVVGLDYGTTYTGVSFCEVSDSTSDHQRIEVIHDWPSRHGKVGTREKVPSEIAYLDDGLRWGCDIPPHEKRHIWTKLELDNRGDGEVAKIISEIPIQLKERKPPAEIVADFLAQVKTHLVKNLDDKYGKELWRTLPITLVVTVPAVWSDVAKHRTMQAVEKAGFNSLEFEQLRMPIIVTTEPEAAALYTIKSLHGTAQEANLAIGDGFIVCDMGGGTVDLISYRVASINPSVIEEATIGSGAQCGGSFIDRAFLYWLERRLGTPDFIKIAGCRSEEIPRTCFTKKAAKLLQDFTMEVKNGFSGTQANYLLLPNPLSAIEDDEIRGISDGELKIAPDDTRAMFDFCLRQTYELVQEQIQRARICNLNIKYVFMVGGFSESPYMFAKIRDYLEKQNIIVIRPPNPWSAIVRGAATKGLEQGSSAVSKRRSRRHYGTSCHFAFQKHLHKECDMFIDKHDGTKRANYQMVWLIKKGQDLPTLATKHASYNLVIEGWVGEAPIGQFKLFSCDEDIAPSRSVEKSVCYITLLTVDLSDLSESDMEFKTSPCGRQYYCIHVMVNISLQSSLEFYATVKGTKFGSVTVSYD